MKLGAVLLAMALALGCEAPHEPIAEPPAEPASAAARWEPARRPRDATLLEHPAHVAGDPASSSEIAAPFRARVVAVHVRVGQPVERGAPVLDVVMPEVLAAAAAVRGATARIAAHRARAEQLEALREEGLVDASRVFEQRAVAAELEAQRGEALAVLQAASVSTRETGALLARGVTTLRAPSAGTVRALDATLGEIREAGAAPFARIVGAGHARVEVRSSEPLPDAEPVFEAADGTRIPLAREPIGSSSGGWPSARATPWRRCPGRSTCVSTRRPTCRCWRCTRPHWPRRRTECRARTSSRTCRPSAWGCRPGSPTTGPSGCPCESAWGT